MLTMSCLEVPLAKNTYVEDRLEGYVIVAFALCFIITVFAVFLFVRYVYKQLQREHERDKMSQHRKTIRLNQISSLSGKNIDDECDDSGISLDTNYVCTLQIIHRDYSSQSRLSFMNDNYRVCEVDNNVPKTVSSHTILIHTSADTPHYEYDNVMVSTLYSLFTSSHIVNLKQFTLSCVKEQYNFTSYLLEMIFNFQNEATESLLSVLISNLCYNKKILESTKLQLQAKYEQQINERKFKNWRNFNQNISTETELLSSFHLDLEEHLDLPEDTEYVNKIIKEIGLGIERCQKLLLENSLPLWKKSCDLFALKDIGFWTLMLERWSTLEIMRYRINIIQISVTSFLNKKNMELKNIDQILNSYKNSVSEAFTVFGNTYAKEFHILKEDIVRYRSTNLKSFEVKLECERLEIRTTESHFHNSKDIWNKKFSAQFADLLLDHTQDYINFVRKVDDNELVRLKIFQSKFNKQVNATLRNCEESLFNQLQLEEFLSYEESAILGKEVTINLKEYKHKIDIEKTKCLESQQLKINSCQNLLKTGFHIFVNKVLLYCKSFEGILDECCSDSPNAMGDDAGLINVNIKLYFRAFYMHNYFNIIELIGNLVKQDQIIKCQLDNPQGSLIMLSMGRVEKLTSDVPITVPKCLLHESLCNEIINGLQHLMSNLQSHFFNTTQQFRKFMNTTVATDSAITSHVNQYIHIVEVLSNLIDVTTIDKQDKKSKTQKNVMVAKIKEIYQSQFDFKNVKLVEGVSKMISDLDKQNICFIEDIELTVNESSFLGFAKTIFQTILQEKDFHKAMKLNLFEAKLGVTCSVKLDEEIMFKQFLKRVKSLDNPGRHHHNKNDTKKSLSNSSFNYKQLHDADGSPRNKEIKRQSITSLKKRIKKKVHAVNDPI